ncbi:MAG: OsmC family protein [Verrucomicrobiota bacterium]
MVSISVKYEGELHCEAIHGPSKNTLSTDAPVDNKGRGETFSPTDLVATGLATCMATIMGQQADTLGIDISGMEIDVDKIMSTERPRRIVALPVRIQMPIAYDEKTAKMMERAAHTCPVHHSIHPDIEVAVSFQWAEA